MNIDASELEQFGHDISQMGAQAHTKAVQVVGKTAADITADAKINAPVDTGNLKGSIGYDMTRDGGSIGAEIGPTASYGIHLEYGTSRMAPQPYLNPAFDKHIGSFQEVMGRIASGEV